MTECVAHFWIATFATLTFAVSVSPRQVTLVNEPQTVSGWHWERKKTPGNFMRGVSSNASASYDVLHSNSSVFLRCLYEPINIWEATLALLATNP